MKKRSLTGRVGFVRIVAAALLMATVALTVCSSALASASTVHVVQPGQTLFGIARWYGVDMWSLARLNGIVNPNRIYVGQRLVIPAGVSYVAPKATYLVRRGDTLYSIAGRYGVTVWALAQANGLYNLNFIYVGQLLVIPGVRPTPVRPAPTPTAVVRGWRGEYFAGTDYATGPAVVRTDPVIDFNWGYGGPGASVGADTFSVRWTRTYSFVGGVYRFRARSDDGVRVWVDNQLIMDAWRVQAETEHVVDAAVAAGSHTITVDYFEDAGIAAVHFAFWRISSTTPVTPVPTPTPGPSPSAAWYGEYFNNKDLGGSPAAVRWDDAIGFEWAGDAPIGGLGADDFSVRWTRTGSFYGDNYAFCAMSDDGVRLYLDGALVLDEWHPSNSVAYCGETNVVAGIHEVRAEYYEEGGNALIYVWWERR